MNFFKLYIGDYQRDTAHLSVTEHGAYLLMLQHYYATEKPLPIGKALHRMLRAQDKTEREAIDAVAAQFWRETPEGLVNDRADVEITKAGMQAETNRAIAQAREAKRKASRKQHEQSTNRATNDQPNHSHSQTPDSVVLLPSEQRAPENSEPDTTGHQPTARGLIGKALKRAGFDLTRCNLTDPRFTALIDQGATDPAEWEGIAREAVSKGVTSLGWICTALQGRRAQAAQISLAPAVSSPELEAEAAAARRHAATQKMLAEQAAVKATKPPAELLAMARAAVGKVAS